MSKNKEVLDGGFLSTGFFGFKTLITPVLIKCIYLLGVVAIVIASVIAIFKGGMFGLLIGLAYLTLGNIGWRVLCEWIILMFSVHETLIDIANKK